MASYQPSENIQNLIAGKQDVYGNDIVNVLLKGSRYAIYETNVADINNRLRVFVDECDAEGEAIRQRFDSFKSGYFEAKGWLNKAANFNMMKYRIASTVSTFLDQQAFDADAAKTEFKDLKENILQHHEKATEHRWCYIKPALAATSVSGLIWASMLFSRESDYWLLVCCWFAASLGGSISILKNANLLNFYESAEAVVYRNIGMERIFLAYVAAAIAVIAYKSGVIAVTEQLDNHWTLMFVAVLAGFSETFIPGILNKAAKK